MRDPTEHLPSTKELMSDLARRAEALTALLVTKEGTMLAEAGNTESLNTTAMAALVAGMFTATREVARMVGEQQFSILLQQGEKRHIHISLVTDAVMMVLVFEGHHRIGRVRMEARRTGEELATVLSGRGSAVSDHEFSVPRFKEYALNLVDQIFQTK